MVQVETKYIRWPPKVEKTSLKKCSEFLKSTFFPLLPWLPKQPKQKNSCSKMWPIDQLYIELGLLLLNSNGLQFWRFYCWFFVCLFAISLFTKTRRINGRHVLTTQKVHDSCKGLLISKCPFGVFKSSKKPVISALAPKERSNIK